MSKQIEQRSRCKGCQNLDWQATDWAFLCGPTRKYIETITFSNGTGFLLLSQYVDKSSSPFIAMTFSREGQPRTDIMSAICSALPFHNGQCIAYQCAQACNVWTCYCPGTRQLQKPAPQLCIHSSTCLRKEQAHKSTAAGMNFGRTQITGNGSPILQV